MVTKNIPLYRIFWDEEDMRAITKVIERGGYWTMGPEIEEFEEKLAEYVGVDYAVAFNSGTSALHALMIALNIKPSDEVIVPSFTFIATANAPVFVGARPVFADIEERRYGLDPEEVKNKITKHTRAIIAVHYGGIPCRIRELKEIAEDNKVILIEDAAESLGVITEEGRKVGTYSKAAVFSFCGNKVITTGEGGAVVTNDKELYKRLKLIRSHGRVESAPWFETASGFDYITLGYNWRMSSITAALGISQLNKIERIIEMRRKVAQYYTSRIREEFNNLVLPFEEPPGTRAVYQMYTIRMPWDSGKARDVVIRELRKRGIITKVYFEPVHLYTVFRKLGFRSGSLPRTELISKQVITLPLYPSMSFDEVDYVVSTLREALLNVLRSTKFSR